MTSLIRTPTISNEPYALPGPRLAADSSKELIHVLQTLPENQMTDVVTHPRVSDARDQLLEQADKRIAQLEEELRRVENGVASARETAIKKGFEQGRKDGVDSIERECREQLNQLRELVSAFGAALSGKVVETEDMAVEVAFTAVRKILGDAYLDRNGVFSVVRQVIASIDSQEKALLRVNPGDYEKLLQLDFFKAHETRTEICRVVPDDSVGAGGCVIDSEFGSLDASLDTQLSILRDTLLEVRRGTIHDA